MDLKNKNISVIGMGRSGIAAANFLASRGANVTLTDQRSAEELIEVAASSLHRKGPGSVRQLCTSGGCRDDRLEPGG